MNSGTAFNPMGKKVISFCLYGDDDLYVKGMQENAWLSGRLYPDWEVWVYTDKAVKIDGATVIQCKPHRGHNLMFARFLPAGDPTVAYAIFRDADSRLNVREKAAVEDWLASDRAAHLMRDHADHANWPILGGMWGIRRGVFPNIAQMIGSWPSHTEKLDDMRFLAEVVYPALGGNYLHHSSVKTAIPQARPFPTHAPYEGHVGQIIRVDTK